MWTPDPGSTSPIYDPASSVDILSNPPGTRFVRDARERGCRVVDGLAMLVGQGRIGISYWTGIDPDEGVMRKALEDVFAG